MNSLNWLPASMTRQASCGTKVSGTRWCRWKHYRHRRVRPVANYWGEVTEVPITSRMTRRLTSTSLPNPAMVDPISLLLAVCIVVTGVAATVMYAVETVAAGIGEAVPGDRSYRSDTSLGLLLIELARGLRERERSQQPPEDDRNPCPSVDEMNDDEVVERSLGTNSRSHRGAPTCLLTTEGGYFTVCGYRGQLVQVGHG